jgi:putative membrane protein
MEQTTTDHHRETTEPGLRRRRSAGEYAGLLARGFAMGSADVVPGVSGGTMAFILGIYEELIQSIRNVANREFLSALFTFRLRRAFEVLNWPFLIAVGSGIVLAILTLARLLEWLLVNHPVLLWSFFFGLVLASVFMVSKRVRRWTVPLLLTLAVSTVAAYVFVGLVPMQTPEEGWFLFLSGALAICAMILPGISGAFVLLLLGKYQYVLAAVNQRDIGVIAIVGAGAAVGIVTFAQVLGWLFRRFHDATVAVLTGLMIGSLRKVWPWKRGLEFVEDRHGNPIPTVEENILPQLASSGSLNGELLYAIGLALLGLVAVIVLERWANVDEETAHQ